MGKSIRSKIKRKHRAVKANAMTDEVLAHKNRLHANVSTTLLPYDRAVELVCSPGAAAPLSFCRNVEAIMGCLILIAATDIKERRCPPVESSACGASDGPGGRWI